MTPQPIEYLPYGERTPDPRYRQLLGNILNNGRYVKTALTWGATDEKPEEDAYAWKLFGHNEGQMVFDLRNGIPMITERDISGNLMSQALGELFAFINGARTLAEFEKFGCFWWKKFLTPKKCAKRGLEPGDNGPGSYGATWRNFPTEDGVGFDQIAHLIEQIKHRPELRTHMVTPFAPQYITRAPGTQQKVVIAPCHGFFFIDIVNDEMSLHHVQRSADAPVGLVYNFVQYALLLLILAKQLGYRVRNLVYTLSDVHIYDRQRPYVERLLKREPLRFPHIVLDDEGVESVFDYRIEHVRIEDYQAHKRMLVPTPV